MTYDEFKQNFLSEFLNINSYAGRMRYADEHLQRIGSGTGRRVYDIDGEKVLKLAMNAKGVAQNSVEAGAGYYRDTQHIVTEVFDSSDDDTWLISEKGKKVTKKRIEEVEGIPNFDRMAEFLVDFERSNKGRRHPYNKDDFSQDEKDFFWENEFSSALLDFIGSYGQSAGDMTRPSSYGEVMRDGQPSIVLTDYGLNDEVFNTYYSGKNKRERYQMYELFNYADGNDDILSDTGDQGDIRRGMWAQMPYDVGDGDGVINENFIKFVSNRDKYPDKTVNGLSELTDSFHECKNNIKQVLSLVENKEQFYGNLLKLQEYLIRRGFYNHEPLLSEEYVINEEVPEVDPEALRDRSYSDELAKQVANKLNLTTPKNIGGGANGFAYEINNNLIMKLTSDISEADAASRLLRGRPKHIAIVFNLYRVFDTVANKSIFVVMEENVNDKPIEQFRKLQGDINEIKPAGLDYEDIMINIKKPKNFNYGQWAEFAKRILTENPQVGISQTEREAAYKYLVGMFDIRQELLDFGIKSTDYITMANLGYKNGVLKFFDVGGYYGVGEPNVGDDNTIELPENITEDYPRDRADAVALEMAQKLSVGEPKYLGAGTLGVAYDIGDDRVLKITKDNSEAYENLKLIGKPLKYIAQPYRVFEVKSDVNPDAQKTYAIILEKLKPDTAYFKRMYDRLDYVFKKIFKINYKHVFDMYQYNEEEVGDVKKSEIDHYFKKNPQDAEFFFSILRIEEELSKYGIESYDYYNAENLGYKPSGVIGFFDVGFTDGFAQPHGAEQMSVNVAEDGSSKFTTDTAINQDEFPPYDTNDTSPMINNDLDANVASTMYEDLEYNHVDGDATEDEYKLEERDKSFGSGSKTVKVKKKCQLGGLGDGTSVACNQGDINNLEFGSVKEERKKAWMPGSKTVEVKKKCRLGGNGDGTSTACNQGDISNLKFGSVNEVVAKTQEEVDNFISDSKVKETVYHGSPVGGLEDFKVKGGRDDGQIVTSSGLREDGMFFTSNPNVADIYRGKKLTPEFKQEVEQRIYRLNQILMTVRNNREYDEIQNEIEKERNKLLGDIYRVKLKIKNPLIFDGKGRSNSLAGSGWDELQIDLGYKVARGKEVIRLIGEKSPVAKDYWKYDGIIGKNIIELDSYTNRPNDENSKYAGNVYVVFSADQILIVNEVEATAEMVTEDLEVKEYFSSLVPDMNEEITSLQDLPFREEIEQLGGKIFSVGGAVRDEFLGKDSKDLDVLITGVPMDSLEQLLSKYGGVNAVGKSFGVLKFVPKGSKEEIDIAIPRTEVATGAGGHQGFDVTSDHALPIEKDLERRDFTINAIAKDIDGNLIDPFGGQEDLKNKIIRIVNPEAFSDDPLRMLRAVQFASRFGFTIEPETMKMIADNAAKIKEIAPERILIELDKIITKGNALIGVELLSSTGLFKQIFGNEIKPSQIGRRDFAGVRTMAELLFLMMNGVVQNPAEFYLTRFSTEDAKRDKTYKELQALDLAFNSDLIDQQMTPVKARSIAHNMFTTAPQTLESRVIPEQIAVAAQELLQGKYPKTVNELAVNGNDLMNAGLQGKGIGDMQKAMLIRIYADNIRNSKEELLSLVTEKGNEVQEGYPNYSDMQPKTWNVNGQQVDINFFVKEYDKWNHQGGTKGYSDASHDSVLEFLQNNYEDFSMNDKLRKELYWALTDRDLLGEEEVKRVSYSAVVLDDKSRASLLKVLNPMIPKGWEVIAHHMTIKMGALENGSEAQEDMENNIEISLKVIDYAMDELVMAVGVEGYPSTNPKPHITIAVNRADGGKPFFSNKLTDWKPLGFPLNLTGKVKEM